MRDEDRELLIALVRVNADIERLSKALAEATQNQIAIMLQMEERAIELGVAERRGGVTTVAQ